VGDDGAVMGEEPSSDPTFPLYLPSKGLLHRAEPPSLLLCKPKLLPLKSVTLEKLEKMQREAEDKLREQESAAK